MPITAQYNIPQTGMNPKFRATLYVSYRSTWQQPKYYETQSRKDKITNYRYSFQTTSSNSHTYPTGDR